eukprot:6051850-Ditylum_brightwellii.AAC.1
MLYSTTPALPLSRNTPPKPSSPSVTLGKTSSRQKPYSPAPVHTWHPSPPPPEQGTPASSTTT